MFSHIKTKIIRNLFSALDIQNCGITENTALAVQQMMTSNTTLVVLDMRNNPDVTTETLSKVRSTLRDNERGMEGKVRYIILLFIYTKGKNKHYYCDCTESVVVKIKITSSPR